MSNTYIKDGTIYTHLTQITLNEKLIINPSEEQILSAGYEIYVPERTLEIAKNEKIAEINAYDQSTNVNIFYYGDTPCWLDKATRVGLVNSTTMEKEMGRSTSKLILGSRSFEFPVDAILGMLMQLEVYAKDCYDVTAQHMLQVNALTTIEDVDAFDITTGYPDKLHF